MKSLYDKLSYQCSKHVTQTYSTSFSSAVRMLAPGIRGSIHAIYGFVRLADEIVDSFHDYNKEVLLDEFEKHLYLALKREISLNPILNSFQQVVHKYNIEDHLIKSFLKSMRADLFKENYDTEEDYQAYIYGSADVVGLMCLKVFVNGDQTAYDNLKYSAQRLGSAFQKVNFLRDIKEDFSQLSRSYFPHINSNNLTNTEKALIIYDIEDDFEVAFEGIKKLPLEARFGVYTAYKYYQSLLKKIKRMNAEEIKSRRVRISNPMKMRLLATSFVNHKLNLL